MEHPEDKPDSPDAPLTRIRDMYTLSSTLEDSTEVDQVTVTNFLKILAEVAVNIASRRSGHAQSNR
jgi:hypothetical protein